MHAREQAFSKSEDALILATEAIAFGHPSMNYLICFLPRFVIVPGSLAMLAVPGERFWASARQRPRRPHSSELPSPYFACGKQALKTFLPGSVVSTSGRILVLKAKGEVSAHPYTNRE